MKLFLASEAKHPESLQKMEEFVGGFANKTMAFIPTAANGENQYGQWQSESRSWQLVQTLGAKVTAIVLEEYRSANVIKDLEDKDIIWFAGGATGYLLYWVRRCELDKQLPHLLEKGSVYVGSSAGSMIASPSITTTEWYIGEREAGAGILPGLGLVDFEIYPHYEDSLLPEIKKQWQGDKLCLLKNGEAVTVVDGEVKVLGEERFV